MAVRQHSSSFLRFIPSILNSIQNNTLTHSHTDLFRVICVNRLSRNYRVLRHWKPFRLKVDVFVVLTDIVFENYCHSAIFVRNWYMAVAIAFLLLFSNSINFQWTLNCWNCRNPNENRWVTYVQLTVSFHPAKLIETAKTMLLQRYLQFFLREICVVLLFAVPKLINCLISIWVLSLIIEREKKAHTQRQWRIR